MSLNFIGTKPVQNYRVQAPYLNINGELFGEPLAVVPIRIRWEEYFPGFINGDVVGVAIDLTNQRLYPRFTMRGILIDNILGGSGTRMTVFALPTDTNAAVPALGYTQAYAPLLTSVNKLVIWMISGTAMATDPITTVQICNQSFAYISTPEITV